MPDSTTWFRRVLDSAIAGLVAAAILSAVAFFWDRMRDGGLIEALGGVPQSKLSTIPPFPAGAVVAFDRREGCPDGWAEFSAAAKRTIVGVSFGDQQDGDGTYGYSYQGGSESIRLSEVHIPRHDHGFADVYFSEAEGYRPPDTIGVSIPQNLGIATEKDYDNVGWALRSRTEFFGPREGEQEVLSNMQPYLALHYCRLE